MNRPFYSFAILVNAIICLIAVVDSLLYFMIGNRLAYLSQYSTWLLVTTSFTAIQGILLLKYYRHKGYRAAFGTGIVAYTLAVSLTLLNFGTLELGFGGTVVIPLYVLATVAELISDIVISFSAARERLWIKAAGYCGTGLSLITLVLLLILVSGKFIRYNPSIESLHGYLLFASAAIPLFHLLNFRVELGSIRPQVNQPKDFYMYARPIAVIAALGFSIFITMAGARMRSEIPGFETAFKKVAEPFDARVFVNDRGDFLNYRFLKPLNYDSTKRYPIVVALHGSSGTGSDNYLQVVASLMPEFLTHGSDAEKFPSFIFVPQCPFGTSWGGHPLPSIDEIVFEALASIESSFPVDITRRYVTGISLGGYGVWHFITSRPKMFAAAIPIYGSGDPTLASKCVDVSVWAFHGVHDDRVPVQGSRDMIEAMKASGGSPRYTEYPDAGHDIGRRVVETPGLLEWMFAQSRDTAKGNE